MKPNPAFSKTLALVAPVTILTATHAFGATDYYLKIGDIKGESTSEKHKDWIDIESFSWGVTNTNVVTGGGGSGKVSFQDFHFSMKVDKASPKLMLACATNERIPSLTFTIMRSDAAGGAPKEYYTVTLSDVLISSYQSRGATPPAGGAAEPPTSSVSFNYHKIKWDYVPADQSETVSVEVDVPDDKL